MPKAQNIVNYSIFGLGKQQNSSKHLPKSDQIDLRNASWNFSNFFPTQNPPKTCKHHQPEGFWAYARQPARGWGGGAGRRVEMLAHLGAMSAHLGAMLAHLGAMLRNFGAHVGPCESYVEPS